MTTCKFYFASFNRASDGAIEGMKALVGESGLLTENPEEAGYIIAVGDRAETHAFCLSYYAKNVPIIHLWAGEQDGFATHDDVYRASLSLMSDVQLCANYDAAYRVDALFRAVDKKPNRFIVGNPYLDDMRTDESLVPDVDYDLILYNPVSRDRDETLNDVGEIMRLLSEVSWSPIWMEPNGDLFSNHVPHNTPTLPRAQYLGLLKNCKRFITNSSSMYSEAAFFGVDVIPIGKRNAERDSKYADMKLGGCKHKVLEVLQSLIGKK